jgi:hypothetical protein
MRAIMRFPAVHERPTFGNAPRIAPPSDVLSKCNPNRRLPLQQLSCLRRKWRIDSCSVRRSVMSRVAPQVVRCWKLPAVACLGAALAGGCAFEDALQGSTATLSLAAEPVLAPTSPLTPAAPKIATTGQRAEPAGPERQCRPPLSLCGPMLRELDEGGFLDFRAGPAPGMAPRLVSPFAVVKSEPLEASRCTGKLCAGHAALGGLVEELLKQGYHTLSVSTLPGGAVVTLRSERIDASFKVLKGSCRFNLDLACQDFEPWLQGDERSRETCGFAQTRVFWAASAPPQFAGYAASGGKGIGPARAGAEALRTVALDSAGARVYELLYVHKICSSEMKLVRNG